MKSSDLHVKLATLYVKILDTQHRVLKIPDAKHPDTQQS